MCVFSAHCSCVFSSSKLTSIHFVHQLPATTITSTTTVHRPSILFDFLVNTSVFVDTRLLHKQNFQPFSNWNIHFFFSFSPKSTWCNCQLWKQNQKKNHTHNKNKQKNTRQKIKTKNTHTNIQVGPSSSKKSISSSSFTQSSRFDSSKSSAESLSSVDTAVSVPQLPPLVPERRKSLEEATQKLIESHRLKQSTEQGQPTTVQPTAATTVNRKSVSFDLSDNEYIPVFGHEEPPKSAPAQTENLAELFLSQFSQESEGDGYEVPIKYPSKGRSKRPSPPVKSILRSPSPNASIPLSSDRPLRTTHTSHANQSVIAAIVHTTRSSDEEIERENPFRKEFLEHRPYENIYEEIASHDKPKEASKRYSSDSDSNEPATSRYATTKKIRPKSAYSARESDTYTEIMPKNSKSNENLLLASEVEQTLSTQPTYKSTGSLIDRPKHKPPLPPKPIMAASSAATSPPPHPEQTQPNVKHADVLQNEALKIFQSEMQRGDFYEFKHDAKTNKIIKVKQPVPPAIASSKEPSETNRPKLFSQEIPLPPIPSSTYTKVYKRSGNSERPPESPPPPPINLATLPAFDKLRKIDSGDCPIVEILPKTSHRRDSHHENSPDYNLVTEATHREILLHENELRNALQLEQVVATESPITTSRIPIRRAPAPPTTPTIEQQLPPPPPPPPPPQQQQIFPQTQILPVQYSQLPTPQQPGYFHAFAPTPMNVCCPSGGYSFVVSDTNPVHHHPNAVPNISSYHHSMPAGSFIVQSSAQPMLSSPLVAPTPVQFHYNQNQNQPNYLNLPNWTTTAYTAIDSHPSNFSGYRQPQQQDIHLQSQSHSFDHNSNRHFEQIIGNRDTTNNITTSPSSSASLSHSANTNTISSSSHIYDEAYEASAVYANDSETIATSIFAGKCVPIATSSGTNRNISQSRTQQTTVATPDNENSVTLTTFGKQTSV